MTVVNATVCSATKTVESRTRSRMLFVIIYQQLATALWHLTHNINIM